jgi:hypothetical protein
MQRRLPNYLIPMMALVVWLAFVGGAASMLQGCGAPQQQDALELMVQADQAIAVGNEALGDALALGTLHVDSADYRTAYDALRQANALMDAAWLAWRAGSRASALDKREAALALYQTVRPLLARLQESQP